MDKEKNTVVIEKVSVDNFDYFLGSIAKFAEYEKLTPPDEEA